MADGSGPIRDAARALEAPPLAWRKPVWLWALVSLVIGVAWPALFLRGEGGLAQLAAITIGAALCLSFALLALSYAVKRPPRLRRHVVVFVLGSAAICALLAPFVFVGLLGFLTGVERGAEGEGLQIAGLSPDMAWAIAPLALAVSAPAALFAGLAVGVLSFRKRKPAPPGVLIARQIGAPESGPRVIDEPSPPL